MVGGAEQGERDLQVLSSPKRRVRKIGKCVKSFGVAAQHFSDQFSCQMRQRQTVAAVALHVVNVLFQATKLRQTRRRHQEVPTPAVVYLDAFELWESAVQFGQNNVINARGMLSAIRHATAVKQAMIGGQAKIIEQIITVFYAIVVG